MNVSVEIITVDGSRNWWVLKIIKNGLRPHTLILIELYFYQTKTV